jgi:GntR family transcriptional regulator/MocR family aminotransferase
MAKRTATLDLTLPPRDSRTPAYRWLYTAVRAGILEGRLRPGARLPATRDLANQYGLSRGTIVNAFDQLKSEGYVEGSIGSGTYVSRILPDTLLQVSYDARAQPLERKRNRRVSGFASRLQRFPNLEARPSRAFRANLPALDLFPTTLWAQIAARRLRRASVNLLLGCDAMGYLPLREAVADYLTTSRGAKCVAEQVAIRSAGSTRSGRPDYPEPRRPRVHGEPWIHRRSNGVQSRRRENFRSARRPRGNEIKDAKPARLTARLRNSRSSVSTWNYDEPPAASSVT